MSWLWSDIIKAAGEQRANHKYISRKPDGRGGWLYQYERGGVYTKPKEGKHAEHASPSEARKKTIAERAKSALGRDRTAPKAATPQAFEQRARSVIRANVAKLLGVSASSIKVGMTLQGHHESKKLAQRRKHADDGTSTDESGKRVLHWSVTVDAPFAEGRTQPQAMDLSAAMEGVGSKAMKHAGSPRVHARHRTTQSDTGARRAVHRMHLTIPASAVGD